MRAGAVVIGTLLALLGIRILLGVNRTGVLSQILVVAVGALAIAVGAGIWRRHRLAAPGYFVWVVLYLAAALTFEVMVIPGPALGVGALLLFIAPLLLLVGLFLYLSLRHVPTVPVVVPPRPRALPVSKEES